MYAKWLTLTAALMLIGAGSDSRKGDSSTSEARLARCLVSLIEEVEVPAQEAGQLTAVEAREGLQVESGALLAQIDDQQAQQMKNLAAIQHRSAQEKATNDVNVRFSKAAARVAEAEYQQSVEANKRAPGTISQSDERRRLLSFKRAALQIEQAELDQRVALMEGEAKGAELAAAESAIERRRIKAPLAGLVVEVMKQCGEWVQPGDPVLKIVRMDRLRVEGFLNSADYGPEEIGNRPVTVEVPLARGRVERFRGKVVFVNPLVEANGEYRVWAEVLNRAENGQWLLRPGLEADMTIDLTGAEPPAEISAKPDADGSKR